MDNEIAEYIGELEAIIDNLVKALEPLAKLAEDSPSDSPDDRWLYDGCFVGLSLGDARRARNAIEAAKD